jgi:hypothetical protein
MVSDTLIAILVSTAYTFNTLHEFRSSLTGELATLTLLSKTVSDEGVFDASDGTFLSPAAGTRKAIIICQDTGSPATSRLLGYTDEGFGLGGSGTGDQPVIWDNGANKILSLLDC